MGLPGGQNQDVSMAVSLPGASGEDCSLASSSFCLQAACVLPSSQPAEERPQTLLTLFCPLLPFTRTLVMALCPPRSSMIIFLFQGQAVRSPKSSCSLTSHVPRNVTHSQVTRLDVDIFRGPVLPYHSKLVAQGPSHSQCVSCSTSYSDNIRPVRKEKMDE